VSDEQWVIVQPDDPPDFGQRWSEIENGDWSASIRVVTDDLDGSALEQALEKELSRGIVIRTSYKPWWHPGIVMEGCQLVDVYQDGFTFNARDVRYVWKHWAARPVYWLWRRWQKAKRSLCR
jgi:hypothetical protein